MSHYAQIKNGRVVEVIVAEQSFIDSLPDATAWRQTSIRTTGNTHPEGRPLRGNYAGVGYIYDGVNDVFYPPQPFPSWSLNTTTWHWVAPTEYPRDGQVYHWNESTQSWQ
jgi:hypothetical protein